MIRFFFSFGMVLCLLFSSTQEKAFSQDQILLRLCTDNISLEYESDSKATLNLQMLNLLLPGSSVNINNVETRQINHSFMSVQNYDSEIDKITLHLKQVQGVTRIGYDFFQLPSMESLIKDIMYLMDLPFNADDIDKDLIGSQELTLHVTSRGDLYGFDVEMPEDVGMQGDMALNMMENFFVMMSEPTFPEEPVSIGDTWIQSVSLDKIPTAELEPIEFTFKLEGIEKNTDGENIARISFETMHKQIFDMFDSFVVGETFEYYDQKEFEITRLQLYFDLKLYGTFKYNASRGYIMDGHTESEFVLFGGLNLKKLEGHNKGEIWSPSIEMSMYSVDEINLISVK